MNLNGIAPYRKWWKSLTKVQQSVINSKLENRLARVGTQLYAVNEIKRLRSGVDEFVISAHQFEARIFLHLGPGGVFWILGGYKKSGNTSKKNQNLEIDKAIAALAQLKEQDVYVSF